MRPGHVKLSGARSVPKVVASTRYVAYVTTVGGFCGGRVNFGLVAGARHSSNDGRHPLLWYGATSVDKADSMHHAACGSEGKMTWQCACVGQ